VVKEEKDCVLTTNRGNFLAEVKKNILQNTYRWANIGSMSHQTLRLRRISAFFNKKF
jgi:hypothetical protein